MERYRIEDIQRRAEAVIANGYGETFMPGITYDDALYMANAALANAVDCEGLAERIAEILVQPVAAEPNDDDAYFVLAGLPVFMVIGEVDVPPVEQVRPAIVAALRSALAAKPQECETDLTARILNATAFDNCDDLFWRTDGEYAPVTFFVNCNDLFYWASADCEVINNENIAILEQAYKDSLSNGGILFCCRVRGMRPQGPYYDHIDAKDHHLFDSCGPERKDSPKPVRVKEGGE